MLVVLIRAWRRLEQRVPPHQVAHASNHHPCPRHRNEDDCSYSYRAPDGILHGAKSRDLLLIALALAPCHRSVAGP